MLAKMPLEPMLLSARFSATVRVGARAKCWYTMPIPSCRASAGLRMRAGRPSTSIEPSSGSSIPLTMLISVDLPAPFSPRIARISPRRTSSEIPAFAVTPGKCFVIPVSLSRMPSVLAEATLVRYWPKSPACGDFRR